jgi:chorismate synthase
MNTAGRLFRISLYGESHGPAVGVVIDGCPAGIPLSEEDFAADLARRKPGAEGTTPRIESDRPAILSGIFHGRTSGSPIHIEFRNENTKSEDYADFTRIPRPGHADFSSMMKFSGWQDPRGSGHFSGRITIGLVAAGVVAKKILNTFAPIVFETRLLEAGGSKNMDEAIRAAKEAGDSIGALVEVRASGVPAGWGEPFFDAVESVIGHYLFAVPAVRGVEFGDGFAAAAMRGSAHNDPLIGQDGRTARNGAGGINGGITNGNEIVLRVAVKPASSISVAQHTLDFSRDEMTDLEIQGRHDACIALRSAVVLEAATACALADLALAARAESPWESNIPWRKS